MFFPDFPSFEDWIGRPDGVPEGQVCRDLYSKAHYSAGSAGTSGMTRYARSHVLRLTLPLFPRLPYPRHQYRTRQLQNVPVTGDDRSVSSDHTYQMAKNFRAGTKTLPDGVKVKLPKPKMCFDMVSGFLRVIFAILTRTEKMAEVTWPNLTITFTLTLIPTLISLALTLT